MHKTATRHPQLASPKTTPSEGVGIIHDSTIPSEGVKQIKRVVNRKKFYIFTQKCYRMEYNIYCDESCHLEHDGIKPMAIGAVWCPKEAKDIIFTRLREIKVEHGLKPHCELKWNAVSQSKLAYYKDVMNYFFDNQDLHFRVLLVRDKSELNHAAYHQSHDSFYYKMYFDMLKNIIEPTSSYNIYLDIKDTRGQDKVNRLLEYLRTTKYDFDRNVIRKIQQVRSHEVELVSLADFLIGAVTYTHRGLTTNSAKLELIEMFKRRSGYSLMNSTLYREDKTNIFIWRPNYNKNV